MNLTEFVQEVSLEDFGREFRHQAQWNSRLRTTGGRFFTQDGHLDFNPALLEEFGMTVFRQIVRHELCHYHLYYQGLGYKHKDREFKELLKAVDGLRYAPRSAQNESYWYYNCSRCHYEFRRKRKVNTTKYVCGKCHGKISLKNQSKV